jgi:hypothetical protein
MTENRIRVGGGTVCDVAALRVGDHRQCGWYRAANIFQSRPAVSPQRFKEGKVDLEARR